MAITVEEGLKSYLITCISTLKMYPQIAPESQAPPFVVYFRANTDRWNTLEGNGSFVASFQLSIYETTYSKMIALRNSIRGYLETKTGYLATGSPYIMAVEIDNETELYETDTKLHHGVLDFTMYFN